MTERDHEAVASRTPREAAGDAAPGDEPGRPRLLEAQGHRGARGLRPENTLPGFAHALEIGVHAIELDVGLTADGVVVVNHDQVLSEPTCHDAGPVRPGDPAYPYVGRRIRDLTLDQVKAVDAGVRRADDGDPFVLTQLPIPGTSLPTLAEVCALVAGYDGGDLGDDLGDDHGNATVPPPTLAVEIKTDPEWPDGEVERFVAAVASVLSEYGFVARSRLLAFDWRVLPAALRLAPAAGRVALAEERTLDPANGWLAGRPTVRPARENGLARAARTAGATAVSPQHSLVTARLVADARAEGLRVSTWTVNEPGDMERLIDLGVDAIVTDYPDRLRAVMASRGLPLPPARHRHPIPAASPA